MAPPLSLQAKRWRTIIVTLPIIGATSRKAVFSLSKVVLYQRLVMGTPQRTLPDAPPLPQASEVERKTTGTESNKVN
ncbi:uncharacterized protein FOMMEDRAFT_157051 [Fomitiporia mediterranea MF3/22]|uniref:uncharacterized protein n=1 Tax=Fomitiporia mediterranea (strain MF3/22) TaxID=694068 RepID=UPI0004408465|nr:uncharacterized protein FOMMEDRAFT_157051 [Fomitiporia mediterranea MF3/22]EJD01912.1 hypothetical protein FOMMEDRAFT_157051 [Fomitiporia mediterranea MF3/22]